MKILKSLALAGLLACATALVASSAHGAGGDVQLSGIDNDITSYGPVVGVHAYIIGSNTCNIGDQNIAWSDALFGGGTGTPALAMERVSPPQPPAATDWRRHA